MKKLILISISSFAFIVGVFFLLVGYRMTDVQVKAKESVPNVIPADYKAMKFELKDKDAPAIVKVVYDGLTMDELVAKLNRSLSSTLSGHGDFFAKRSLELGIDPYLAVAISMYETGCKWGCSTLVVQCNNVGGVKGNPGCNGGSFRSYASLNDGINAFLTNLKENYYDYGLDTAYKMEKKYTGGSTTWASRVMNYFVAIKNN